MEVLLASSLRHRDIYVDGFQDHVAGQLPAGSRIGPLATLPSATPGN
jgi:hypothetical protein